jgi:hypothetical protein
VRFTGHLNPSQGRENKRGKKLEGAFQSDGIAILFEEKRSVKREQVVKPDRSISRRHAAGGGRGSSERLFPFTAERANSGNKKSGF